MPQVFRMCYDKILPSDLQRLARPEFSAAAARMAVFRAKKWPNGSTLRIRFVGGTTAKHRQVKRFAAKWTEHANLKFDYDGSDDAQIRISFLDEGASSYIGTDALRIPRQEPTMNLGWIDEGVVLHEFGHAIGLIHEHQNPAGGIQWDRPAVIADLSGPPNNWDLETIEHNMFRKYDSDQLNATRLDPASIMLYAIPQHWTLDDFSSAPNDDLSPTDTTFISSRANYPFPSRPGAEATDLTVVDVAAKRGRIGRPGEQDLYTFTADEAGRYAIQTEGPTDVVMSLYGPESRTRLVAEDDDSGTNRNARIAAHLRPGTYFVQVRHYNAARGTGSYNIQVTRQV